MAQHDDSQDLRAIHLRLSAELVERIDQLKEEFGLRSRGAIVERLLSHLFTDLDDDDDDRLVEGPAGAVSSAAVADAPEPATTVPVDISGQPQPLEQLALEVVAPPVDGLPSAEQNQPAGAAKVAAASAADTALAAPAPGDGETEELGAAPVQEQAPAAVPRTAGDTDAAPSVKPAAVEAAAASGGCFDESSALVLVAREGSMELVLDLDLPTGAARSGASGDAAAAGSHPTSSRPQGSSGARGIDLPGFVRRRSDQLRRSLHPRSRTQAPPSDPLPTVAADRLEQALARATGHWVELYGSEPHEAVLEASMIWLAQDIWPQSDQCEGRPFSWSLVQQVMTELSPSWPIAPASFARVMVAAGILEDPFSVSTLDVRIPTLIRRFVHRFRRRRPGASFQTLEHTMTLHGALRLLQLPTTPGQRLTLPQIRESYREMALAHHPDAGGSEEAMRRLNEAYQLLKELYRTD